jgi:hypothetical protein
MAKRNTTDGKKEKKKFKDWGVVKFLKEKAPDVAATVIDVAGDLSGIDALKNVADKINKSDKLTPEDRAHALKLLDKDIEEQKEITKRWVADSKSDSWLSKNVRPLTLLYLLVSVTVLCVLDSADVLKVKEHWVTLFSSLLITTVGAYFGLREVGKYVEKKYSSK